MSEFKNLIYNRFFEKSFPVYLFQDKIVPSATIWVGIRAWCKFFREIDLTSGDRIILNYPESPTFLHILFASIWEELSLFLVKSEVLDGTMIETLVERRIVSRSNLAF